MKTIFVSSTFRDMQFERDALREITAPLVNREARQHNDAVDFCDLRWGVNTADLEGEESSRKVLEVCLDEIERSDPPMVVMLGYRYGWIPPQALIRSAAERKSLVLEDLERSVTALEIEYGALCDPARAARTLFYFREIENDAPAEYLAEDAEHARRTEALKARIRALTGGRVKTYTVRWNGQGFDGIREFAETAAEDIAAMLCPGWAQEDALTPFERERRTHETFIREKAAKFLARHTDADQLFALAQKQPVTVVKGAVGSGKSTLFSCLAQRLSAAQWTVLPFISGLTNDSNDARDIVENTVYWLELQLGLSHYAEETDPKSGQKMMHSMQEWREKLAELCAAFGNTGKKLLLMVDAADQFPRDEWRDRLAFIPFNVGENIHFLMTCTPDLPVPGLEAYELAPISEADKRAVIAGALASGHELTKPVEAAMLGLRSSDNPLYLSLLVRRLQMMDRADFETIRTLGSGISAIEKMHLCMIKTACPDELDGMSAALLDEAGARINPALVKTAARFLAVSRHGLRRQDLAALTGKNWSEVDFAHFLSYMNDCFMLRDDGRFDFTHKSIRAGFLKQVPDLAEAHRTLLAHFASLPSDDPVRISEIAYHAIQADDKAFFVQLIEEISHYSEYSSYKKTLCDQTSADNGTWFISLLESIKETLQKPILLYFAFEMPDHTIGAETCIEIHKTTAAAAEALYDRSAEPENQLALSEAYRVLGMDYMLLAKNDNLDLNFKIRIKKRDPRLGYDQRRRDRKKQIKNFKQECAADTQVVKANLNQAEMYFNKSKDLCLQLPKENESDLQMIQSQLFYIHQGLGGVYTERGEKNELKMYFRNMKIREKYVKKNDSLENLKSLLFDYLITGSDFDEGLYKDKKTEERYKKYAFEFYEKAIKLGETIADKYGIEESFYMLLQSLRNVTMNPNTKPEKRRMYLKRGIEICEMLDGKVKSEMYQTFCDGFLSDLQDLADRSS